MTSSAASETDSARKRTSGCSGRDRVDDRLAAAVREVDVEEHDLRVEVLDQRDRRRDRPRLADHLDGVAELGLDAREEEPVIVDEDDAPTHDALRGMRSSTSVPSPGVDTTDADRLHARAVRGSTP